MANSTFSRVAPARVPRSIFDLSHQRLMTGDLGKLYPVMCLEAVPGDVFDIAHEMVVRFNPMVAPVLHEINAYIHCFFVPNRITWTSWEDFITGGKDGTSAPTLPQFDPTDKDVGSLWDHLGLPTDASSAMATDIEPVGFPAYAYNQVYNDYYRDETQVTEVAINQTSILTRAWEKDYFTSALPWQQRGTAPALPVTLSGTVEATGIDEDITMSNESDATARTISLATAAAGGLVPVVDPSGANHARWNNTALEIDASGITASTFDVSDLRLAIQQQRILERNARAGARYTEWLRAHFGTSPRDDRLDRAEYIGGMKAPVIVSEVLQTGETGTTAQGNMAGHGITVDRGRIGRYRVVEFGVIISIMSIMPRSIYSQGVPRNWLKTTRWDYYNPALAHLSEQQVIEGEIYAQTTGANNTTVFGYQGRFNELRHERSTFTGKMRSGQTFDHWHLGRIFSGRPSLNQTFIECVPKKDYLASSSEDAVIVSIGNRVKAARPLPVVPDPGLMDH